MRLTATLVAATILGFAAPASGADYGSRDGGWRHHHHGHARFRHHRHHGQFYADEAVAVVEYREPYLPRGVLYNAPPLPVADQYAYRRGHGEVISARY